MLDMLREKQLYESWMLAVIPMLAVCNTLKSGLIISALVLITLLLSALCVFLLKSFLTEKTAFFAQVVIAAGISGGSAMLLRLFFDEDITALGIYVPLVTIAAVLLVRGDYIINTDLFGVLVGCGLSSVVGVGLILVSSIIREILGYGSLLGFDLYGKFFTPISFFASPAGGLLTAAIIAIVYGLICAKTVKAKEAER